MTAFCGGPIEYDQPPFDTETWLLQQLIFCVTFIKALRASGASQTSNPDKVSHPVRADVTA